jgi:hypothetical protein
MRIFAALAGIALLFAGLIRPRGLVLVLCRPSQWKDAVAQAGASLWEKFKTPAFILPAIGALFLIVTVPISYRYATRQSTSPDPFIYGEISKQILAGERLYIDTWQDKPPLAYLVYAIPQYFGDYSYRTMGLILGFVLVAEGLMFFAVFRREMPVAFCCLLFTTLFPMAHWDWVWPSLEHYSNLCIAAMLLIAYVIHRDRRFQYWQCAVVGVLPVISFHLRQPAVIPAIIPIATIMFADQRIMRKIRGLALLGLTAIICWVLILLLTAHISTMGAYFWTVFQYPGSYLRTGKWKSILILIFRQGPTPMPMFLFLFAGLAFWGRFRWLVLGSLIVGLYVCLMPKRPYGHYWVNLFPFIALYMGIALQRANIGSARMQTAFVWAISIAGLMIAVDRLWQNQDDPSYEHYRSVADELDRVAPPGAKVLTFGGMPGNEIILYNSKLPAANKYCFSFQFKDPYIDILPMKTNAIYEDYLEHPPDVICASDEMLKMATTVGDPKSPAYLLTLLFENYTYQVIGTKYDYAIAARDTTIPRHPPPAPVSAP